MNIYPQCLMLPDHHGRLPIHSVCKHAKTGKGGSLDVVEFLVGTERRSLMYRDMKGRLPLHVAFKYKAHRQVVEVLLSTCPASASVYDKEGRMPLHVACIEGADTRTIFNLFWSHHEALVQRDNKGSTPIDYAQNSDYENTKDVVSILEGFQNDYFDQELSSSEKTRSVGRNRVSWHQDVSTYDYDSTACTGVEYERNNTYDASALQTSQTFDAQTIQESEMKESSQKSKSRLLLGSIGESIRRVASGPM